MEMVATGKLKPLSPVFIGQIVDYVEKEAARKRASIGLSRWHVIQTEPQQERRVEDALNDLNLGAYFPRVPKSVRVNAVRRTTVWRPMLTSYGFAGFDPNGDEWHAICGIRGAMRLFMIDFRPVPVAEREMERVRYTEALRADADEYDQRPPRLNASVGDLVQAKEGPFSSFFGFVVEANPEKNRFKVELDIFTRKTPVDFEGGQLEIVA